MSYELNMVYNEFVLFMAGTDPLLSKCQNVVLKFCSVPRDWTGRDAGLAPQDGTRDLPYDGTGRRNDT